MGIILNGCSIILGGILGNCFKRHVKKGSLWILGISIMLMSLVGIIENLLGVSGEKLESNHLLLVIFALIIGGLIGEGLKLEERLSVVSAETPAGTVLTGCIFFGVGALQITGPVSMVLLGDNSQLILKCLVDFPFAVTFGAAYGLGVAVSGVPIMLMQAVIALAAYAARGLLSAELINQLCALGYIILFFMGLNISGISQTKINTLHLIPALAVLILYQICRAVF